MRINLIIKPRDLPFSWKKFCNKTLPFSIALDGYVSTSTKFDQNGPRLNFNHHEGVDRLSTRSTCAQVFIAIRQGLFELFKDDEGPKANVYVNDCDEDICLACFLLKNHNMVANDCPDKLTKLVAVEDLMDASAGAYPLPIELSVLKKLAWIFEPYRLFRVNGGLDRRKAKEFEKIINDVSARIEKYLYGKSERLEIDTKYKKIGGGQDWTMFEEIGSYARSGAYKDGVRAYVSVRKVSDERWVYSVGKPAPYIKFDIPNIIKALNKAEGKKRDKWGGADTISGSPRVHGSNLPPDEVERIINEFIDSNDK